jgi:CheY-like chemotaxis protein
MRILAVEDDAEYLEMLQVTLQSLGHTIVIAHDGTEALKALETQPIDVIVSDVKMPGMDGVEFHQRVREKPEYRNTPFIFLTGISDISGVRAVCKPDLDLLLQKPFPVDKLLQLFAGKIT